ncbi:MAG: hypothetical protein R3D32_07305 [Nitratireductor sp.]
MIQALLIAANARSATLKTLTASLLWLAFAGLSGHPAFGQTADPSPSSGKSSAPTLRFELRDEPGGFVRLDLESGELSFCKVVDARLTCLVSVEEREAYQNELARLEDRVIALEKRLDALGPGATAVPGAKLGDRLAVPPESIPQQSVPKDDKPETGKPQDDSASETARREFEKAMDFAERAMRRFFDTVQEMRKEMEEGEAR